MTDQAVAGIAQRSATVAAKPGGRPPTAGDWSVIFTGPDMHDNLAAVAPKHPKQKYVFFDDQLELPNVLSIKYAQNDGSYPRRRARRARHHRQGGFPAFDRREEGRAWSPAWTFR